MKIATLIYSDRLNTYHQMKILDEKLNNNPSEKDIIDMAEYRIRNLLCFSELQSFNDTSTWLHKHPVIAYKSTYSQLEELYQLNHKEFLKRHQLCLNNISRYSSFLKNESRSEKRDSDNLLLDKHKATKIIFESVIENNKL